MKHYYINAGASKNVESLPYVHASWCPHMKNATERTYVGLFADARKAVSVAQEQGFAHASGCQLCCPETRRSYAYQAAGK